MIDRVIISLFDYTGNWSKPYRDAGYTVIQHDLKLGQDILNESLKAAIADHVDGNRVHGIMAAIPCTDFAVCGAKHFRKKETQPADYDGPVSFENTVELSVFLALATLFIVELLKPVWWVAENPISRIHTLVPEIGKPKMYFNPCDFGHPYTKKTALYGEFNTNLKRTPVLPLYGSMMHTQYGGKSEKTKALRSITPSGFAQAFFKANP